MSDLKVERSIESFWNPVSGFVELDSLETDALNLQQREKSLKHRLASQILNSLDFNTILETAINEVRRLIRVECCQFLWYHSDRDQPKFEPIRHICKLKRVCSRCASSEVSPLSAVTPLLIGANILRINDVECDRHLDAKSRKELTEKGIKSLLAVVIHFNSGEMGVLYCEHRHRVHIWRDREVELLQEIADCLALAIDRARLYAESQNAAKLARSQAAKMQRALTQLALTQAQLIQTEKMSSLGLLVAGVAHEINNPINFIYGNLHPIQQYTQDLLGLLHLYEKHSPQSVPEIEALKEKIDFDFIREDFPKLIDSMALGSTRIRDIVKSLRTFSRVDESEIKSVDIHQGIDSTLLILQNRLKTHIEVIKDYGELPQVECYPGQMNQVFMNIIANAIESLESLFGLEPLPEDTFVKPHGFPKASAMRPQIRITTELLPNDWISICIADNGLGITENVIAKLFDPFFTTKPIGKGTGLGLSISYEIIAHKHKGKLSCRSTPGNGAEFRIEIPVQQMTVSSVSEASKQRDAICFGCHEQPSCQVSVWDCDRPGSRNL